MKKLRLNLQHLDNVEVLTRSQLKKVFGGAEIQQMLGTMGCETAEFKSCQTDSDCGTCTPCKPMGISRYCTASQ